MTEHEVGGIDITLEDNTQGTMASAMVSGTLGYRHKKMYQGYTEKQILKNFAKEVTELESAQ